MTPLRIIQWSTGKVGILTVNDNPLSTGRGLARPARWSREHDSQR